MSSDETTGAASTRDRSDPVNLPRAAAGLLQSAKNTPAGRAGRTLTPGAGAALKQSLLALAAGRSLADHESPAAATLQVISGTVRLTGGRPHDIELREGDLAAIPPVRHGLEAVEDAVVLLSVAQGPRPAGPEADDPPRHGQPPRG
jgi:quercetin dioxygenase-like cupin family protein